MNRKHNLKLTAAGVAVVALLGTVPAVIPAHAAPGGGNGITQVAQTTQIVTGTLNGLPFVGEISDLTVSVVEGVLTVTGTLTGAGLPGALDFSAPLDLTGTTCEILSLDLGPLDLDVLGLVIHLDPVVLDIDAQPGPGKLVGNLLCAVAGLLDGGGPLAGISALLNRLLSGLGL